MSTLGETLDLRTTKGTYLTVVNSNAYPVVVNDLGQSVGGGQFAKVSSTDATAKRAMKAKLVSEFVVSKSEKGGK